MKKISVFAAIALLAAFTACGDYEKDNTTNASAGNEAAAPSGSGDAPSYDPKRGEGKWTAENVNVKQGEIDKAMATEGEKISNTKCLSCHKISDEKLVGPGWAGVTERRTPEWIMNFITNPDPMLDKDPEAQAMLEICLVRMPNQNLSDNEARAILEYMRQIDAKK